MLANSSIEPIEEVSDCESMDLQLPIQAHSRPASPHAQQYNMVVLALRNHASESDIDEHLQVIASELGLNLPEEPKETLDLITDNVSALTISTLPDTGSSLPSRQSDSTRPTSVSSLSDPNLSVQHLPDAKTRVRSTIASSIAMRSTITVDSPRCPPTPTSADSVRSNTSSYAKIRRSLRRLSTIGRPRRTTIGVTTFSRTVPSPPSPPSVPASPAPPPPPIARSRRPMTPPSSSSFKRGRPRPELHPLATAPPPHRAVGTLLPSLSASRVPTLKALNKPLPTRPLTPPPTTPPADDHDPLYHHPLLHPRTSPHPNTPAASVDSLGPPPPPPRHETREARAARERSLRCARLQRLRTAQLAEQARFLRFRAAQADAARRQHAARVRAARAQHAEAYDARAAAHAEAAATLEHRQLDAELELTRSLARERAAAATRLRHMEAYCASPSACAAGDAVSSSSSSSTSSDGVGGGSGSGSGSGGGGGGATRPTPVRVVTADDRRRRDEQAGLRDGLAQLHAGRINVLREKQARAAERLAARQAAELRELERAAARAVARLEAASRREEARAKGEFAGRKRRLLWRWKVVEAIERRRLELERGEEFGALPDVQWGDEERLWTVGV